ncbi:c-type cytochrome [Bordetella sp. 02P26C-1]|uniref:c-type cytochrome n=1 Tax=unclassified Bordetella TaxID=2630031 RepID=UPI0013258422|nr:c-type cytochrome [Bordetella sp. 15P40C-2]MVW79151.1 c-type cytochrome [Bordetella sp. 02P26C-1]
MLVKTWWKAAILCAWGAAALIPSAVHADQTAAGMALAQRKACMGCHQVDVKRVGPPLRSIGERYAAGDDKDAAVQYLAGKIRSGGQRVWGAVPMPAQGQVSEQEARELAQWILTLPASRP